jgi:hypothetical protein
MTKFACIHLADTSNPKSIDIAVFSSWKSISDPDAGVNSHLSLAGGYFVDPKLSPGGNKHRQLPVYFRRPTVLSH